LEVTQAKKIMKDSQVPKENFDNTEIIIDEVDPNN
jgi:hypothetical protein